MTPAPETGRTAEESAGCRIPGNVFEHRTGMVFETDPVTGQQVCTNEGTVTWSSAWPPEAKARIEAAEAEAAHLRAENANLRDRVREAEGAGRDPDGSGHSRAEPASGLGPADECPSRAPWQPIATAPTDRPITLRMPAKCLPGGWFVATAQLPDPDDDSRFGSCSTIYHYNGAVLMGGFRGTWTHWREDAPPALGIDARSDETRSGSAEGESPSALGGMLDPLSPEPQEAGDGA